MQVIVASQQRHLSLPKAQSVNLCLHQAGEKIGTAESAERGCDSVIGSVQTAAASLPPEAVFLPARHAP